MKSDNGDIPTQFAITNLNVPDRLDLQDMRNHSDPDNRKVQPTIDRRRVLRGLLLGVLGLVGVGLLVAAYEAYSFWHESLSTTRLEQRLSAALGVPVKVGDTQLVLSPTPHLLVQHVAISKFSDVDEVSIGLGVQGVSELLRGKGIHWGEAVVHSAHISPVQGGALMQLLPRLGSALPHGVTAFRVERLEFDGTPWVTAPMELLSTREGDGEFGSVVLQQDVGKTGHVRVQLAPGSGDSLASVQLEGKNLRLPFGARFTLEDVLAEGSLGLDRLDIDKFSLAGTFGLVRGEVHSHRSGPSWLMQGKAQTEALDLETLIRLAYPVGGEDKDGESAAGPTAIQGTVAFSGTLQGVGDTVEDSLAQGSFSAPLQVRWVLLNGVDLGYVATHPGASGGSGGGSTRFSSMDAQVLAGKDVIRISDIQGKAGALQARGSVVVDANGGLDGLIHVDLGVLRVTAPSHVEVHGDVVHPKFVR